MVGSVKQKALATEKCVICGADNPPQRRTCSKACQYASQRKTRTGSYSGPPSTTPEERRRRAKEYNKRVRKNTSCVICDKPVIGRLTCSDECMVLATNGKPVEVRSCFLCERKFKPLSTNDVGLYCDSYCQAEARRRKRTININTLTFVKCDACGKQCSTGKRFCSSTCAGSVLLKNVCDACGERMYYRRVTCPSCGERQDKATPLRKVCIQCGGAIGNRVNDNRTKLCSDCAKLNKRHQKRAGKAKRRAVKRQCKNIETINPAVVYERDKGICQLCGKRVRKNADPNSDGGASLDHIIPLAKGGDHTYANIQLAHRICNTKCHTSTEGKQMRLL